MIVLTSKYPGKSAVDAVNYALAGKARDVTASGDGTGTPLEKDWMNDLFGWQQALMAAAGLTPNNTVETQISSQLLQAIRAMILRRPVARYTRSGTKNAGVPFTLAAQIAISTVAGGVDWVMTGDAVQVPAAGAYRIAFNGQAVHTTSTTNPTLIGAEIWVGGAFSLNSNSSDWRPSAITGDSLGLSAETVVNITTPSTQKITVVPGGGLSNIQFQTGNLIIEQVG